MNVDNTLEKVDLSLCDKTYGQFLKLHNEEIHRIADLMKTIPSSMGMQHTA